MGAREAVLDLEARMSRDIVGQKQILERILIGLLANGNLLVEGLPGLAKTRAIKSLAKHLDAGLSRIQFTPDLLPSDITGTEIYYGVGGEGQFRFDPGPIFNNLILADEINRAPAKVQAALLEAMEERQVTVAGTTHELPALFLVMATQNPIEQEGTYPLPEAQMDRFLMKVLIEYPSQEDEGDIVRLVRGEEKAAAFAAGNGTSSEGVSGHSAGDPGREPSTAEGNGGIPQDAVFQARREIHEIHSSEAIDQYVVGLIDATRHPGRYSDALARLIELGASPRGALGLDRAARAHAWLNGQDHVTPDNVRAVVHDVLRHRIMLSYEANAAGTTPDGVIDMLVEQVAVA